MLTNVVEIVVVLAVIYISIRFWKRPGLAVVKLIGATPISDPVADRDALVVSSRTGV